MADVLTLHGVSEHHAHKVAREHGLHITVASAHDKDVLSDEVFKMDIDPQGNCGQSISLDTGGGDKQEPRRREESMHAAGRRAIERDGSFVLIRSARSISKSESDGSAASSPEDHSMESLVWREKDKVSLTALPEKLDKGSPYVGTFHHGHGASGKAITSPKLQPLNKKLSYRKSISDADKFSSFSSEDSIDRIEAVEQLDGSEHRSFMKEALKLEDHVPHTPELCGIQGLLPRKSGVRVLEKIGEGSFGKIVKAHNFRNTFTWDNQKPARPAMTVVENCCKRDIVEYPHEGETLVLKCIRSSCAGDADIECVRREIRIHGRCQHPNIVKFYGHYDHDEYVTLILGYVIGKELHDILEMNRRIPEHEALMLFLQMLGAVEHLHSMQIVHRDLKPRNVLVTASNRVYVIDLGLALDLSDPADLASWQDPMVGTMGYLAPEMHLHSHMGLPVDIWALGTLFYETVCGFQPFQPYEVVSNMVVEFPDAEMWGISVSQDLQSLITQMLDKDQTKRIAAAHAMQHCAFTATTMAEVAAALAAPQNSPAAEAPIQDAMQQCPAKDRAATCETVPLKLQLTQANSVDWTGQYYFNYCLATVGTVTGD